METRYQPYWSVSPGYPRMGADEAAIFTCCGYLAPKPKAREPASDPPTAITAEDEAFLLLLMWLMSVA